MDKVVYKELSFLIVGLLFEVYNELGPGYKEMYYKRAFEKMLIRNNLRYRRQPGYTILFKNEEVVKIFLDFLVEDSIVLELNKGDYFAPRNIEQVNNYLKATNKKLGILVNFTSNGVKFKRILNIK